MLKICLNKMAYTNAGQPSNSLAMTRQANQFEKCDVCFAQRYFVPEMDRNNNGFDLMTFDL